MSNNKSETFTYTVPANATLPNGEPHPDAGKEIEKSFDFLEVQDADEANAVIAEKKWSLVDMVNKTLKANARSSAYQSALAVYKPSEMTPEEAKERMIRAAVRQGASEENARKMIEALLG